MATDSMSDSIEALAELLVLSDLTDLQALADIHTRLQQLRAAAQQAERPAIDEIAEATGELVEKVILEEVSDPPQAFDAIGKTITGLQTVVRDGRDPEGIEWPRMLGVGIGPAAAAPAGFTLPAHIDESIFSEFLSRQTGVLDEIEHIILSVEKGEDGDAVDSLKRIIHTLKGESAMLGLAQVEHLCHSIEDALVARPPDQLTDALLTAKDWLGRAFDAYGGQGSHPGPLEAVLESLQGTSAGTPAPQAAAEGAAPATEAQAPPAEAAAPAPPVEEEPRSRPLEGDPELLGEFVAEANEHLDACDVHLLTLETTPKEGEALNAVFRAFHTIKGVAGFLALEEVQSLAHEAENLLDKARKDELVLEGTAVDVTFDAVDMLKRMIANVGEALSSGQPMLIESGIRALQDDLRKVSTGALPTRQESFELPHSEPGEKLGEILVGSGATTPEAIEHAVQSQKEGPLKKEKIGDVLVKSGATSRGQVNLALDTQERYPDAGKVGEILTEMESVSKDQVDKALETQTATAAPQKLGEVLVKEKAAEGKDVAQALRSQAMLKQGPVKLREAVKVDAIRLDLLLDTIGELVIAESMVVQSPEIQGTASTELLRHLSQLDKITRELQEMGTSLRMVPIRATFQKMARLVRDLAKKSGKRVDFVTAGEDTELDKSVVDKIGDPLVHMVRNSVDHGIEPTQEERSAAGKPPVGTVELRAFHKGGSIYIEIQDDGRGLDRDRILAKARERGIISEHDNLSERDIWNLIFEPGFSTAQKVTDVSGRGVGMDVVKRNIEALRGQTEIQSVKGVGTTFSIRLPLTLAIIDGMVVRAAEERYIIPTLSIIMSVRPEASEVATMVGKGEMLNLRDRLLPLFRLRRLFSIPGQERELADSIVMVVEDEGKQAGIVIDEILGQQQIVIKSLGESLKDIPGIAGGAIMPDGTVGLILDVGGLVKLANDETPAANQGAAR